jgi:hypothetical protein
MEFQKQFSFVGSFRKKHGEDDSPIESVTAKISCNKNGTIFLEVDSETNEKISHKRFFEYAPIYKFKNCPDIKENDLLDPFLSFQLSNLEQELVQPPYEGDYLIEGESNEGWTISANIADANFTASFSNEDSIESLENEKKHLIRLSELHIDYNPENSAGQIIEAKYGLSNLNLFCNFSTFFLNSKHELILASILVEEEPKSEILSAEMILKNIDKENLKENAYNTYSVWFQLLISFATGEPIGEIYRVETRLNGDIEKKVEYWPGRRNFRKGGGIAVFQQPLIHLFIEQCASKVTWNIFAEKGLGSALRWYIQSFETNVAEVEFILLCTVLETLNKHHLSNHSRRLISKNIYKKIRSEIINILNQNEIRNDNAEVLTGYRIFESKVKKSFEDGSLNQVGPLRANLKQMIEFYEVPYQDLFPELEFINIRDKIVHEGHGGSESSADLRKLANLVVRIFLSILQYKGEFIESKKIELENLEGCTKHGLAYKTFPFLQ